MGWQVMTGETYLESAEGVKITHERAMQELRAHGADDSWYEFLDEVSPDEFGLFDAGHVLAWLGY